MDEKGHIKEAGEETKEKGKTRRETVESIQVRVHLYILYKCVPECGLVGGLICVSAFAR